jgi:hypothetical protein
MAKFYILAERMNIDNYPEQYTVSRDNTPTDDYDSFLFFDQKEEAEKWVESDSAKEWKGCTFEICEEE